MTPHELSQHVPWECVFNSTGLDPGRHSRTRCIIHGGDNSSALSYSDKTGKAHCFSCGWHGDKIDFLRTILGVDFKTALAQLAGLAGVALPAYRPPSRKELAKVRADQIAYGASLNSCRTWRRETHVGWSDEYREPDNDAKLDLELLYWVVCNRPHLLSKKQAQDVEARLAAIYNRRTTLEYGLDLLTYSDEFEAERFAWWQAETASREAA